MYVAAICHVLTDSSSFQVGILRFEKEKIPNRANRIEQSQQPFQNIRRYSIPHWQKLGIAWRAFNSVRYFFKKGFISLFHFQTDHKNSFDIKLTQETVKILKPGIFFEAFI